jgi:oligopeptide transport system ATP-binding protein
MSSLNPIMPIGKQITESMRLNGYHLENQMDAICKKERVAYLKARRDIGMLKKAIKAKRKARMPYAELKKDLSALRGALPELKVKMKVARKEARTQVLQAYRVQKADKLEAISTLKRNEAGLDKRHLKRRIAREKEALKRLKRVTRLEAKERAIKIMREVGIPEPEKRFNQYPFQFSGGMRQRIVIAVVLAGNPDVLICDEPTTALDVTIQSQILELIKELKKERGLTVIFITHDLGVVANIADRIAVMYAGKIQEIGTSEEVFYDPRHPYTWALLGSMPDLTSKDELMTIPGSPPDMRYPPIGDAFAPRSDYAMKIDFELEPPMFKISDTHYAATWLLHKDSQTVMKPALLDERIKRMKEMTKELLESEEEFSDL